MRTLLTLLAFIALSTFSHAQVRTFDRDGYTFTIHSVKGNQVLFSTTKETGVTEALTFEPGKITIEDAIIVFEGNILEVRYTNKDGKQTAHFHRDIDRWRRIGAK